RCATRSGCPCPGRSSKRPPSSSSTRSTTCRSSCAGAAPWRRDASACRRAELLQDLIAVALDVGALEDVADGAVFVDKERGAVGAYRDAPVSVLLAPDAVLVEDVAAGVGDEGERQVVLARERVV